MPSLPPVSEVCIKPLLGTTTPYPTATWQTTSTVTAVSGCKSYDNYGKIVETAQQAKATVQVCGYSGELAPTETNCAQFVQGTNLQQSGIHYSVNGGVIAQNLSPGVFFYFSRVIPSVNGVQRITITEANTGGPGNYNFTAQQVQLFTAGCGSMRFVAAGNGSSVIMLSANLRKDVPYIIAVKYDSKSIAGRPAPSTDPVYYSFGTFLGATQTDANANAFVLTKGRWAARAARRPVREYRHRRRALELGHARRRRIARANRRNTRLTVANPVHPVFIIARLLGGH